jgi:hypothetical protein
MSEEERAYAAVTPEELELPAEMAPAAEAE